MKIRNYGIMLMFAVSGVGCYSFDEADGTDTEDLGIVDFALTQYIYLPGYRSNINIPYGWWYDTGTDLVTNRYRVQFSCYSGTILPWPGHPGMTCAGQGAPWNQSVAPSCTFGSLVGKVGQYGQPFCIGSNTGVISPSVTGRLYIAFNDGVNFQDNSGGWNLNATVTLNAHTINMPFTGLFNKNGAANPASHPRFDFNNITDWSTDLFAAAGTDATFSVSSGLTATVVWKGDTCPGVNAGTTLFIDLSSNGVRYGRAVYSHLDGVTLSQWSNVGNGTVLGKTKQWPLSWGCYEVSNANDVHIHFELGTDSGNVGINNEACWRSASTTTTLPAGSQLGQFGQTGYTVKQACP